MKIVLELPRRLVLVRHPLPASFPCLSLFLAMGPIQTRQRHFRFQLVLFLWISSSLPRLPVTIYPHLPSRSASCHRAMTLR